MHPILFRTTALTVESYPVFVALGFVLGGVLVVREVLRRGWPVETMLFIMAGCTVGAVIGSRLLVVLFVPWQEAVRRALSFELSSKTIVGGIVGGYAGVELVKRLLGFRQRTGDAFAIAIPAGGAVGRIGCLAGGCCFGVETALPWGLRFPPGSPAWLSQVAAARIPTSALLSLPVHPTQVYEVLFDIALIVLLRLLRDRMRALASLFRLYLFLYASYRFCAEFLRGDSSFPAGGGLKTVQYALMPAILLMGFLFWRNELRPVRKGPSREVPR